MKKLKILKEARESYEINDLHDLMNAWQDAKRYWEVHAFKTAYKKGTIQEFVQERAPKEIIQTLSNSTTFSDYLYSLELLLTENENLGEVLPIGPHYALMDSVFSAYAKSKDCAANFMLYGPPGCGKTLTAKYLAYKNGLEFRQLSPDRFMHDPELVRILFGSLRRTKNTVLFVDEIDELARDRDYSCGQNWGLNTLLSRLDGTNWDSFIFVGATNLPWMLDQSLLRSGRIDYLLYAPTPTEAERLMLLRQFAPKTMNEKDLAEISQDTRFYSTADIKGLCKKATHRSAMLAKPLDKETFYSVLNENPSTAIDWYEKAISASVPSHTRLRVKPMLDELEEYKTYKGGPVGLKAYA